MATALAHIETGWTDQRYKLEAAITALGRCRDAADRDELFGSREGIAAVNALHDLTDVDGLYDLAQDMALEFAPEPMRFRDARVSASWRGEIA